MQIPSHVLGSLDYLLKHTAEIDEKHMKINRGTKTPSMVARWTWRKSDVNTSILRGLILMIL